MPDKIYTINTKQGNIFGQMESAFRDIFARRTLEAVRGRVNKAVDREMGNIFKNLAVSIYSGSEFPDIRPAYTGNWRSYSTKYKARKLRKVGHLLWFKYEARTPKRSGEPWLSQELYAISPASVLGRIGYTSTNVSKDKKKIIITVAPKVRVRKSGMERDFSALFSERALRKLQNRRRAYRALVGPVFDFVLTERIPQLVSRSLRRF
jgi:hypothetical protein